MHVESNQFPAVLATEDWADIIEFLTMYPEARRQVARLLGEIDAH